eukprot:CAMPEP_0173123936 /NCGR_PEP_ID=MMETSP1102-20130122/55317_1 /TAXON_ID=49646 /ORGANISM="Geminigera sp., Strain Caron Lab Isolate" /LENGTH=110 /DNA_ID=CAMNT_0014032107 /DNA_START=78 /DNA_END=409 /DNA_ORIENTATION=+
MDSAARRAKAVQEQETQSADTATTAVRHCDAALLDFVVVLVRLGVPGSAQEYASQAPCEMEAQEWLATVMLDQDAMAGEEQTKDVFSIPSPQYYYVTCRDFIVFLALFSP